MEPASTQTPTSIRRRRSVVGQSQAQRLLSTERNECMVLSQMKLRWQAKMRKTGRADWRAVDEAGGRISGLRRPAYFLLANCLVSRRCSCPADSSMLCSSAAKSKRRRSRSMVMPRIPRALTWADRTILSGSKNHRGFRTEGPVLSATSGEFLVRYRAASAAETPLRMIRRRRTWAGSSVSVDPSNLSVVFKRIHVGYNAINRFRTGWRSRCLKR